MALVKANLKSAIETVLLDMPVDAPAAALALATAYYDYARAGMFGASVPTLTGTHRDALKTTLEGAIAVAALGLPATFAAAWAAGVAAFWTSVPVAGAQLGTTNGCPGASSLTGSLSTVFANLANTASTCASGMADALDTATKTVKATVSPPAGTIVSIA